MSTSFGFVYAHERCIQWKREASTVHNDTHVVVFDSLLCFVASGSSSFCVRFPMMRYVRQHDKIQNMEKGFQWRHNRQWDISFSCCGSIRAPFAATATFLIFTLSCRLFVYSFFFIVSLRHCYLLEERKNLVV